MKYWIVALVQFLVHSTYQVKVIAFLQIISIELQSYASRASSQ